MNLIKSIWKREIRSSIKRLTYQAIYAYNLCAGMSRFNPNSLTYHLREQIQKAETETGLFLKSFHSKSDATVQSKLSDR